LEALQDSRERSEGVAKSVQRTFSAKPYTKREAFLHINTTMQEDKRIDNEDDKSNARASASRAIRAMRIEVTWKRR